MLCRADRRLIVSRALARNELHAGRLLHVLGGAERARVGVRMSPLLALSRPKR